MNAVMARILGRAGSGGALRWAWVVEVKISAAQKRKQERIVPRRINCLQTGRSNAAPLQDTGFGRACALDLRLRCWRSMLRRYKRGKLNEGGDAGDALADYELVNVVGAFVGGDAFEVVHMAHDAVVVDDAISAENVACFTRDVQRNGDVVHLQHGDVRGIDFVFIFQAADMQGQELPLHDFRDHPGELFLYELMRGDGLVGKLLARFGVLKRSVVAGHVVAQRAPSDAVARLIEAAERTFESDNVGQQIFSGDLAVRKRQA